MDNIDFGQIIELKSGIVGKVVARHKFKDEFFLEYGKGGRIQSFTKGDVLKVRNGGIVMDERIQEMRLKLDKISWEPDQLEKNKQAFDFIVMYSDYLIQQAAQIESMAHVIKVKNKEMRELSNFLKERNIPLKELSPLITVMARVRELERDRAEWEIESHTQNARNKRLELENQRYKETLEEIAKEIYLEGDSDLVTQNKLIRVILNARQVLKGES